MSDYVIAQKFQIPKEQFLLIEAEKNQCGYCGDFGHYAADCTVDAWGKIMHICTGCDNCEFFEFS